MSSSTPKRVSSAVYPKEKPPRRTSSTGMKRTAAPPVPGRGPSPTPNANTSAPAPKKPAEVSNGRGPAPLTYSSGEPADDVNMNEVDEKVILNVFLASGKSTVVTVDSNIPMLDLLVHLAARCKVSPSGHELQVREEETGKVLEFKPNQTIGSLGATTVYLLAKNKKPDWSQAAKTSKAAMAFEITHRFTINLPGGQKAVMRVSPQLTLAQVLDKVCQDKSLDTRRYTLQHPTAPGTPLNPHQTIADSKLAEINLVHAAAGDSRPTPTANPQRLSAQPTTAPMSSSAASAGHSGSQDPASWYMPGAGETKKKKGFLSFLSKKEKKFKLDSPHNYETSSTTSHHSTSALPPAVPRSSTPPPPDSRSTGRAEASARRPHTMYVTSSSPQDSPREQLRDGIQRQPGHSPQTESKNNSPKVQAGKGSGDPKAAPRGGGGKKRPAPPPPQAKAAVHEEIVKASSSAPVAASAPPAAAASLSPTSPQDGKHLSPAHGDVAVAVTTTKPGAEAPPSSLLHSRNSSDSSGYHELTLSGAESPEAAHVPTTFKTSIDTTSIDSGDNLNGDSGIQDISPASDTGGRVGSGEEPPQGGGRGEHASRAHVSDGVKTLPSTKKKKAPPPPQSKKAKPAPVQEETTETAADETDFRRADRPGTPPEVEEHPPPPPFFASATGQGTSQDSIPPPPIQTDEAPASLKLNLDFLEDNEESDMDTDRKTDNDEEPPHSELKTLAAEPTESEDKKVVKEEKPTTATAESEYNEAFDLDDILNSVVFDEEPRRSSINIHSTVPVSDREDGEMMMVETSSVVSEEVEEVMDDVRSRPCEFIAPPPPDEPPPEDYSPRGSGPRFADKSTVVDEDNVSLAPSSLKNSPVSKERGNPSLRRSSNDQSSDQTSQNTPIPVLHLATEEAEVIPQERHHHHILPEPPEDRPAIPSLYRDGEDSMTPATSAFAMTEEISAPLETVPPPLQFQTDGDKKEEEEEEEEVVTTVTEEYIVPVGPGGLNFAAAVKVSEEEEKTRVAKESISPRSKDADKEEKSSDRKKENKDSAVVREAKQAVVEKKAQQPPPPAAAKEEFVLTLEDLSSVSLVPLRPKKYTPARAVPTPTTKPAEEEEEVVSEASGSPQRSHLHLAYVSNRGHVQSASSSSSSFSSSYQPAFTQSSSHHTAKESSSPCPSITPAQEPKAPGDLSSSSTSSSQRYLSTAKLTFGAGASSPEACHDGADGHGQTEAGRPSRAGTDASSAGTESAASNSRDLQQQYSSLQQQFTVWQQQLQQNQTTLAAQHGGGALPDDTLRTLQLQVQMQQQMMEQLQKSMQALTLQQQNSSKAQEGRVSPLPPSSTVSVTPPPPPAPVPDPAPARSVARAPGKKVSTQPVSQSRFQPQLDPREQLMIAVRSFGGISGLKTVPVRDTRWASSNH